MLIDMSTILREIIKIFSRHFTTLYPLPFIVYTVNNQKLMFTVKKFHFAHTCRNPTSVFLHSEISKDILLSLIKRFSASL